MHDLILHQYPLSPFSEKVRLILGFKGLSYDWVRIPVYMPKPDVIALTGGYRRTPFLQIGCDVYCDTRLIASVLDARAPQPALVPKGDEASATMLAEWADHILFSTVTPFAFKPEALARMAGDLPPDEGAAFVQDRMAMAQTARTRPLGRIAFDHLPEYLRLLEAQLSVRDYLLGTAPTVADFSVYHSLWFLGRGVPEVLEPHGSIRAWMQRMASIGHGRPSEIEAGEAITRCRAATPAPRGESLPGSDNGSVLGDTVQISPIDYGHDPTVGELIFLASDEIVVRREDPRAGVVHVHFPRVGFQMKPA